MSKDEKKKSDVKKKNNKKKSKIDYKKIDSSEKTLLTIFILLAIVVCILGCIVIVNKNQNRVIDKVNITIPVIDANSNNSITIDAKALTTQRYYVVKITNYRENKVNKKELEYNLTVENKSGAILKVTKNDDQTNLMKDNKKTMIAEQKLVAKENQDDIYYISIVHDGGVKKDETIEVTIDSKLEVK